MLEIGVVPKISRIRQRVRRIRPEACIYSYLPLQVVECAKTAAAVLKPEPAMVGVNTTPAVVMDHLTRTSAATQSGPSRLD